MKRLLSIILAIAMVLSVAPSVFAEGEAADVLTYNFLSTAIDGSNKVSSTTATYENTAAHGSAPWQYVNTVTPNNNTAYNYELCYNWYGTETYKTPEQGDGGIVLKLKVEKGGWYSAILNHIAQKTSVNAKVFLLPVSTGLDFTSTWSLKDSIKSIPEEYYLGYADGYAAKRAVKTTALKYKYIAEGEYYLVIAPHGINESYKESDVLQSNGKYLYVFSLYSFVLDPTAPSKIECSVPSEAINVGGTLQAEVGVTVGENIFKNSDAVTWESVNNSIATIDEDGKISGISEGIAEIKAYAGDTASESAFLAVINPEKTSYEYIMGGRVLNTVSDTTASGSKVDFPQKLYNVIPSDSMPWKLVRVKNANAYQLYYAKTTDASYYGVVMSSVTYENVNNSFFAYSVYVPKAGVYQLDVNSLKETNYGKAKVYFSEYADIAESDSIPSETGPVTNDKLVAELNISDTNDSQKSVGEVVVPAAGEYLLVIVPSDANSESSDAKPLYKYKGFSLTPAVTASAEITLDKTKISEAETAAVSVKAYTASGNETAAESVTYTCSDETVAEISENGVVTPKRAGVVTIGATVNGIDAEKVTLVITGDPNEQVLNDNATVYVATENGADASLVTSETAGIAVGSVSSIARKTPIKLIAADNESHKFRYWIDLSTGRFISAENTISFVLTTNTSISAVYSTTDGKTLVDFFNSNGVRIQSDVVESESAVTVPTQEITKNGYNGSGTWNTTDADISDDGYRAFVPGYETAEPIKYSANLNGIAGSFEYNSEQTVSCDDAEFSYWTKDGKIVSYDKDYTFRVWGAQDVAAVCNGAVAEEEKQPSVVLLSNGKSHMLELVNFSGIEILEKGIIFGSTENAPTIGSFLGKAKSITDSLQFTAEGEGVARAYVIYSSGGNVRVAYSD